MLMRDKWMEISINCNRWSKPGSVFLYREIAVQARRQWEPCCSCNLFFARKAPAINIIAIVPDNSVKGSSLQKGLG